MTDLEKIADDLSALTVLEAANLSKLLEEKWGVSAAAPVAVAPPADVPCAWDASLGVPLPLGVCRASVSGVLATHRARPDVRFLASEKDSVCPRRPRLDLNPAELRTHAGRGRRVRRKAPPWR